MSAHAELPATSPLRPGIAVTLNLDGEQTALDCVIAAVQGQVATLVQTAQADPQIIDRLHRGRSGYLLISNSGSVIGLRGTATVAPAARHLVEFLVTDQ